MNIVQVPSPNFQQGRKTFRPEAIVIHIMQGTLYGTDSWFQSPASKASAHYGIGRTGEVHQYVNEPDTALHAGRVNAPTWPLIKQDRGGLYLNPDLYTIGIEHEGDVHTNWSEEMYKASSSLIKAISVRWGIAIDRTHIIGHHEIYSLKKCPGYVVDIHQLIAMAQNASGSVLTGQPFNV